MAIPSGSGSEVLKRTTINAQSGTATAFRWDGTMATTGTSTYTVPTNHIITVISIIANEQGGADELISLYMHNGADNLHILQNASVPTHNTFVWNDRFVLTGGDKLIVDMGSTGNVDFICNYIDQDWS
mgnify:CR=1 FL=1